MHFRRRAVDLVGEQQIGEYRAERGGKVAGSLIVNARADQIGRHQIRRKLNALERAANRSGERFDGQRLGESRHALDEQVSLRQDGDQHALEKVILADDDFLHFIEDALHEGSYFVVSGFLCCP